MEYSSTESKSCSQNGEQEEKHALMENGDDHVVSNGTAVKSGSNAAQLQKKLERRIEKAWHTKLVDQQPKKSSLLPIGRIPVPNKVTNVASALVTWDSDSENEFEYSPLASNENTEINQQLLGDRDANNSFDEDDLDLIPPQPIVQRCICCHQVYKSCSIQ